MSSLLPAMADAALPGKSGYQLLRVYAIELHYALEDASTPGEPPERSRPVRIGWDWQVVGARTFDIALLVELGPSQTRPETMMARVAGTFAAEGDTQTVSFAQFVREHGPAILLPYVREHLTALSGRGPYGAFYLAPLNIGLIIDGLDANSTQGARQLRENPALAQSFGLAYLTPELPRPDVT